MSKPYHELKTVVVCNKTLVHADGSTYFTKGKEYSGRICNIMENLTVTNDQGNSHRIGNWDKHFKFLRVE